ncbi:MAG: YdcF family protein, partial [Myxococcota bacterium]
AVLPGGEPSPSLRARAEGAAALWALGRAPLVVCTGAHHLRPPGEAVVAREILLARGVPAEVVLIEEISRNTKGNLRCARGVLPPGARRIYVVTEPFHMGRALAIARAEGFEPLPWPVDSPAWSRPAARARWLLRDGVSMAFLLAGA